jgi:predicted nucleotidyltransferase
MTPVSAIANHPKVVDEADQTPRARQLRAFVSAALSARDLGLRCRAEAESEQWKYTRHALHLRSEASRHYARAIGYLNNVRWAAQ